MTSSNGNIFRVSGPLCGEFIGHQWIPLTKASDAELWCFLWSAPEQMFEWTIETLVSWDVIAPSIASLWWSHGTELRNHWVRQYIHVLSESNLACRTYKSVIRPLKLKIYLTVGTAAICLSFLTLFIQYLEGLMAGINGHSNGSNLSAGDLQRGFILLYVDPTTAGCSTVLGVVGTLASLL